MVSDVLANTMTTFHPQWTECVSSLYAHGLVTPNDCDGTLSKATVALRDMGGVDVKASLAHFRTHHGCCDCEIIFNILFPWYEEIEKRSN